MDSNSEWDVEDSDLSHKDLDSKSDSGPVDLELELDSDFLESTTSLNSLPAAHMFIRCR